MKIYDGNESYEKPYKQEETKDEELIRLRSAVTEKENLLKKFLEDVGDNMECLPSCDRLAHDELCPVVNPAVAWRQLRKALAAKEKECERLRDALSDIASGEMGINISIRTAKQALEGEKS